MTCNRNCDCVGECKAGLDKPTTPTPGDLSARHAATLQTMIHQSDDGAICICAECRALKAAIAALSASAAGKGVDALPAKWRARASGGYTTGDPIIDARTETDAAAYANCADELEAALTRQPVAGDGWRPISTMPTDDTMILAGCADGRIMVYRASILARNIAGPTPEHLRFPADGWMPLPPAPEVTQ